jgi:hypothetical protein
VEGKGHVADSKWMMKRGERPCGRVRARGAMTHGSRRKGGKEDDVTGEGPTRVKDRAAKRDEAAHEPLI